jgi:FtsZ-binding cell division protein ZapB
MFEHSYSSLTRIPGNLFASTPKIKAVHFYNNKIQHVGEGLLDHLQDLRLAIFSSNICISKTARSECQVPALIFALRNCTDIETETTTEITATTEAPEEPQTCDFGDIYYESDEFECFVCKINDKVENLKINGENIESKVEELSEKNEALEGEVEELKVAKEILSRDVETMKQNLLELEQMVIDLTTRPCAC